MSNLKIGFFLLSVFLFGAACAEKKTRIWIEPPLGLKADETNQRKLYYQVEDLRNGRKENLMIPVEQIPENLVIEDRQKGGAKDETGLSAVTRADQAIKDQKLPKPVNKPLSLSYLKGVNEIESLYQKSSFAEALIKLTPLIEEYPSQSRLFLMQGTLYSKIGEKRLALQSFRKAGALEKNNHKIEQSILTLQSEFGEELIEMTEEEAESRETRSKP